MTAVAAMAALVPVTVIAHLHTPAVVREPILLDGVLVGGLGAAMGQARGDGYASPAAIYGASLPLARVTSSAGWWWAASQATPWGPERVHHAHRRLPAEHYARWTRKHVTSAIAGPDKALRVQLHYRPQMMAIRWTCVGDPAGIVRLLSWVGGIGNRTTHGHGQVERWEVQEGGPPLTAYRDDVTLRHLPVAVLGELPGAGMVAAKRLRPPYWSREDTVDCLFVPQVFPC